MKFYLEYEQLKSICISMAEDISKGFAPHEIIAVSRGGLTPAHIIGKYLRLPVGVFFPDHKELHLYNSSSTRIVFVEDLIKRDCQKIYFDIGMISLVLVDQLCQSNLF